MEQRKVKLNLPFGFMFGAAFLFSACGGHQFSSLIPTVPGTANERSGPHAAGKITLSGPIVSKFSGGFTIESGINCGYIQVYVNSSTTITGGSPAVGLYAQVTGTGTCATSISATSIILSNTGNVSLSGPVVGKITGGFTIESGNNCGYVHIYMNSSTKITGGSPTVGLNAEVTGYGTCATSIIATSITLSKGTLGTGTPSPVPSSSVAPYSSPSPTPYSSPGPPSSPIPYQSNATTLSGPIAGTFAGGFQVYTGVAYGHLNVYTNSSTAFGGGSPKTGLYVLATGISRGSRAQGYTATYVASYTSAPATVTLRGTVSAVTPYGFIANLGAYSSAYSAVPVVMNAATIVGGAPLVVGANVKVTGPGAQNEAVVANSIVVTAPSSGSPTPAPISQKHVLTADYLGAPDGSTSIAWSAAAPYLNWAQVPWTIANAVSAAGIKTQLYADPNRTTAGTGDPLYTSNENTFAHDCNGNRVTDQHNGGTQYVMAVGGSSMQTLFANYVTHVANGYGSHFDAIYEDDSGPLSQFAPYAPMSAMPCNYSDSQWLTYGEQLDQDSPLPIIINGLGVLNGHSPSMSLGLLASNNTIGGNFEGCYSDDSLPKWTGWAWQAAETSELEVASENKIFECQMLDSAAASSSSDVRIYALASFLLSYSPSTSILMEFFGTPSRFHVMPESQLVALDPIGSTPSTVAGLLQNGGNYGRQYSQCYLSGKFVGACAVVVNSDGNYSHPFPFPQYNHTLVLNGSGILDGGTVATNGAAPPASLGPGEAAVAFP